MRAVDAALKQLLSADAGLAALGVTAVYKGFGPADAVYPFVVFAKIADASRPWYAMGVKGPTGYDLVYAIQAVTEGLSSNDAGAIDERLQVLLDDAEFAVNGYTLIKCERGTEIEEPEEVSGKTYWRKGAQYHISIQKL